MTTALIGQYNVANLLGVIATMRALGVPLAGAARACCELQPVPGRMECLQQQLMTSDTIDFPDLYPADLSRAYAFAVASSASFVRYAPPSNKLRRSRGCIAPRRNRREPTIHSRAFPR